MVEVALKNLDTAEAGLLRNDLILRLRLAGAAAAHPVNTPYVNTIPAESQPRYPGNRDLERRIKSLARWNAMAMVVNAQRNESGVGGHISSYASMATLYEVGYNHFFRGGDGRTPADLIYFQGHTTPGNYARAFLEYRLEESHLHNFRRELAAAFLRIRILI
jgi:pyruvate dehydrogenase E1 component